MPFAFRPNRRAGLTLVEILISLTMTLIVLGSMMTAFRYASEEMQEGRALIELANRVRVVEDHLRTDLGSLTVETRVYNGTVAPTGYFEYIEGPTRDSSLTYIDPLSVDPANPLVGLNPDSYLGDIDDALGFTARSTDGILYRGRSKEVASNGGGPTDLVMNPTRIIESSLAEIIWFTVVNDNDFGPLEMPVVNSVGGLNSTAGFDDSVHVHRRVLLIRPDLGVLATGLSFVEAQNFIRNNDISVRLELDNEANVTFNIVANSLDDLAIRENRFAHQPDFGSNNRFPNNLLFDWLQNRIASDDGDAPEHNAEYVPDSTTQAWEALPPILSDVAAFDLQVYSPTARVNVVGDTIVEPSDPGYNPDPAQLQQLGAYVDLGYSELETAPPGRGDEWFIAESNRPIVGRWEFIPTLKANVWDTWTPFYERDGIDQDGELGVDQGTNSLDDGGSVVIDDPLERETRPPYLEPIRGMKITLRLVEKGTKQVHQISVIHSFVPE